MDNNSVKDAAVSIAVSGGIKVFLAANPIALPYVLGGFGIFCICNVISSIASKD